jgi:DNA-binding winged helix-turn-helix (wHTH) protein
MDVNSVFKGFFNNPLVVRSGIVIAMSAFLFIASSFTERSDRDLRAKQTNLIIREIGHRLLLQSGDSTSRVLPVTETKEGTFLLAFENDFIFSHDSLMMLTHGLLPKTQFPSGYTVTVHDCTHDVIVYGFQVNNTSADILPCRSRSQLRGCYTIEIAFPDLYANAEQKEADLAQVAQKPKSLRIDPKESNPKHEELKSIKVDPLEVNPQFEVLKSFKADLQDANPKLEEFKTTTFDHPLINLVSIGILLLGVGLLIGRYGNKLAPVPVQTQNPVMINESASKLTALGKFLFDVKDQRLLMGNEVISLTDKECRILELLNKNFSELIPRETLMQEVWINEGVITGRSLDMFVSKLRKKLSTDPELRITNVHGKGYKLEIPGIQS